MSKSEMWERAGAKLRELRKEKGLSVHKTGRQLGVSGNYISLLERGKTAPTEALLIALAEFYEVDRQKLFDMYEKIDSDQVKNIIALPASIRKTINQMSIDKKLSEEDIKEAIKVLQRIADDMENERLR